jgi:hypothetical protein
MPWNYARVSLAQSCRMDNIHGLLIQLSRSNTVRRTGIARCVMNGIRLEPEGQVMHERTYETGWTTRSPGRCDSNYWEVLPLELELMCNEGCIRKLPGVQVGGINRDGQHGFSTCDDSDLKREMRCAMNNEFLPSLASTGTALESTRWRIPRRENATMKAVWVNIACACDIFLN